MSLALWWLLFDYNTKSCPGFLDFMGCCFHNIVIISYLKNLNVATEGNFEGTYFFSFQTQCNVKIDSMCIIAILGVSKSTIYPHHVNWLHKFILLKYFRNNLLNCTLKKQGSLTFPIGSGFSKFAISLYPNMHNINTYKIIIFLLRI